MRAIHNTRNLEHRDPFGAVAVGSRVKLSIDVFEEEPVGVHLRVWSDTRGERVFDMEPMSYYEGVRYTATYIADIPELVWYSFVIDMGEGRLHMYGAADGKTGGEGVVWWEGMPPSFQLTVYKPRETDVAWYDGGIVYQIFPDRFFRGADWRERSEVSLSRERKGPARKLVEEWNTPPRYQRDEEGRISSWDFYGGTLSGVREKLDYLASLGVTAIYLNPIFEAASSHRYDVGNYLELDPMLGDDDEFSRLVDAARDRGISIILDGVFNHVGRDSRYFNFFGNYDTAGAWQGENSPYSEWFEIHDDKTYTSWWGVDDLPSIYEDTASFQELIFRGKDSVVRKWMRAGARGWRLDVADELPESFIRGLRRAMSEEDENSLLIGEVWEDASNKVSYGMPRHYLLGDELDCSMNYVLRDALLDYLLGRVSAHDFAETLTSLQENYPPEALARSLTMLGSHDRPRILTLLGGAPDSRWLSEDERASYRLSAYERGLAIPRLWLAVLMQMTLPGVPSIYYGDEAGLEGYSDPFNRAPYPWGEEDPDAFAIHRNALMLRKSLPLFTSGSFSAEAINDDVISYRRADENTGDVCVVLINRSTMTAHDVAIPMERTQVADIASGHVVEVADGMAHVVLQTLGSAVLYFHDEPRLGAELDRGSGILAHVSSLPTSDGAPGTFGEPARAFIDWLEECSQHYWQILPLNPTDEYGSPYAGISAFAGNPRLLEGCATGEERTVEQAVERAFAASDAESAYAVFCERERAWLDTYAAFMAIKKQQGVDVCWTEWPNEYRDFEPSVLERSELAEAMEQQRRIQFAFEQQWIALRSYAAEHGIKIIGDMPMYVSLDSADVWAHREIFQLDENGYPTATAGAPPDNMAVDGQSWGNPVYNWQALHEDDYSWWLDRLARAFELYDFVRLDHFLGFAQFFCIPVGGTPAQGSWQFGPGRELFDAAFERFGSLPIIAEDLGLITPATRALVEDCGFWGMDVIQFGEGDVRAAWDVAHGRLAYTSTHDTATLVGWCTDVLGLSLDDAQGVACELIEHVEKSSAPVCIVQLQDACGLGDEARMNVPGVAEGNWSWQANAADLERATEFLRELTRENGRGDLW